MNVFDRLFAPFRQPAKIPREVWCIDMDAAIVNRRIGFVHVHAGLSVAGWSLGGLPLHTWNSGRYDPQTDPLPSVPPERGVWILFEDGSYERIAGF